MKSRRTFLLLEMLIALSIMAGALSLLFIGFYGTIRAKNTLKSDKERIIERERLRLRFAILFKKVICVKECQDEGYYIRYQGDVESDSHFRSEIEAFLRVENKTLKLTCWPPSGTPREEILSTNISTITLQFFDAKAGQFLEPYPNTKPFMMKVILNDNPIPLFL